MRIGELKSYFGNEVSGLYSETESEILFEIFAEKILGKNRINLRNSFQEEISDIQQIEFFDKISHLKTGKPYQQIFGETEFFGMKFFVNEHVLIPRPETEELLEFAIEGIKKSGLERPKILDIGTGSGVIPIVLKKKFPKAEVSAVDISPEALAVARRNAEFHQCEINFILMDFLETDLAENYDIIISNPPYIGADEQPEIEETVKNFEPKIALFSPGADPLLFYRKIAADAEKFLNPSGMVFLEINQKYGPETLALFEKFREKKLFKDLSGNVRFVVAEKSGSTKSP